MFDDPRKALNRLETRLLIADEENDEFERFYSDVYDEFDPEDGEEERGGYYPLFRNYANGYGRDLAYAPEEEPEEVLMDEDRYEPARPGRKSNPGLAIVACTECIAVAAVMIYGVIRLLL